jgi:hypothetical protein
MADTPEIHLNRTIRRLTGHEEQEAHTIQYWEALCG